DAFKGRLWAEIVRPGRAESVERALLEAASRLDVKPVASPACYFAEPGGHATYRLLCAVRQGVPLDQLVVASTVLPAHSIPAPEEAAERWADLPDAVANTVRLAEMCSGDVLPRGAVAPPVQLPKGQDAAGYLKLLCERAYTQKTWRDEPAARRR